VELAMGERENNDTVHFYWQLIKYRDVVIFLILY